METIFDHNVTKKEIEACGFLSLFQCIRHGGHFPENLSRETYLKAAKKEDALFDIALLMEHRGESAEKYWRLIPDRAQEYKLGFDTNNIPI